MAGVFTGFLQRVCGKRVEGTVRITGRGIWDAWKGRENQ